MSFRFCCPAVQRSRIQCTTYNSRLITLLDLLSSITVKCQWSGCLTPCKKPESTCDDNTGQATLWKWHFPFKIIVYGLVTHQHNFISTIIDQFRTVGWSLGITGREPHPHARQECQIKSMVDSQCATKAFEYGKVKRHCMDSSDHRDEERQCTDARHLSPLTCRFKWQHNAYFVLLLWSYHFLLNSLKKELVSPDLYMYYAMFHYRLYTITKVRKYHCTIYELHAHVNHACTGKQLHVPYSTCTTIWVCPAANILRQSVSMTWVIRVQYLGEEMNVWFILHVRQSWELRGFFSPKKEARVRFKPGPFPLKKYI